MFSLLGKGLLTVACWAAWTLPAFASPAPQSADLVADLVVVEKGRRTMLLFAAGQQIARYYVALGKNPVGKKHCTGDNRTPEGVYQISGRKPNSDFHRALRISYPSPDDVANAQARGCTPGGDIMIHGLRPGSMANERQHLFADWTRGCVAVTNKEIEQIWSMVRDGTRVEIKP